MALGPGVYEFRSLEGDPYSVRIPEPVERDSFFVFSLPRAGSTLLDNIMRALCQGAKIPRVTIPNDVFDCGVQFSDVAADIEKLLDLRGFAYLGFRQFFSFEPQFDFSRNRKLLLVRDPRDMLVSLYYSIRYSHRVPERGDVSRRLQTERRRTGELDVDSYIRDQAEPYRRTLVRYRDHIFDGNLRLYRYEDVIFDKRRWVADIAEYLELDVPGRLIKRTAKRFDLLPRRERPTAHVRQVRPGNHKKHLNGESISRLNEILGEELEFFGYEP